MAFSSGASAISSGLGDIIAKQLGPLREAVSQLTGGMTQLTQSLSNLNPFVAALSPGDMQQFAESIRNVNATIGQALLPVIEVFTDMFQQLSGVLGPVMRDLAPVFASMAQTVATLLIPVFELFASVVQLLTPWFQLLADSCLLFYDALRPLIIVVKLLVDLVKSFGIFSAVAGAMHNFLDVLGTVIKQMILLGAAIAQAAGVNIQPFIDALKPKKAEINAAPQNAAIKSFDQIRQDITNAAFVAGGTTGKKTQDEWSEELVKQLQAIKDQNKTIGDVFNDGLKDIEKSIESNWQKICVEFGKIPEKVKMALGL